MYSPKLTFFHSVLHSWDSPWSLFMSFFFYYRSSKDPFYLFIWILCKRFYPNHLLPPPWNFNTTDRSLLPFEGPQVIVVSKISPILPNLFLPLKSSNDLGWCIGWCLVFHSVDINNLFLYNLISRHFHLFAITNIAVMTSFIYMYISFSGYLLGSRISGSKNIDIFNLQDNAKVFSKVVFKLILCQQYIKIFVSLHLP